MSRAWTTLAPALVLAIAAGSALADPPAMTRDEFVCLARSGVGFSYWWGGECWCRNDCAPDFSCGAGSCSGSCPDCTHSGSYGADCSGYVSRIWQVPDPYAVDACGTDRYVAASFTSSGEFWTVIGRDEMLKGDALASSSHVMLYESGDPWGTPAVFEAKGCSYGIVYNTRSVSSSYNAARRVSVIECTPTDEVCDGEDNDCDTIADEDDPGGGEPCGTDEGECVAGVTACVSGSIVCTGETGPTEEVCDGLDNDCDTIADEGCLADVEPDAGPDVPGDPPGYVVDDGCSCSIVW